MAYQIRSQILKWKFKLNSNHLHLKLIAPIGARFQPCETKNLSSYLYTGLEFME
jgi:hypothetical protein